MLPRIDYETSVELVLSAAREYFNSSADLMDSCMDLARYMCRVTSYIVWDYKALILSYLS